MLAIGHQVQVIGELDYLGQLFEDVDAEALATELGVGGYIPAAAATTISQNPAQLSTPAAPPSLAYGPHLLPKHETHTQQLTHRGSPQLTPDLKVWLLCLRQGTVLGTQPPVPGSGLSTMTKGRSSRVATVRCRLSTTGCRDVL